MNLNSITYHKEKSEEMKRRSLAIQDMFLPLSHTDVWGYRRVAIFILMPLLSAYSCVMASIQFTVAVLPEMYNINMVTHSMNANFKYLHEFRDAMFKRDKTVSVPVTAATGVFCALYALLGFLFAAWVPYKILRWRIILKPHLTKSKWSRFYSATLDVVRGAYFMHQYFLSQIISLLLQLNRLLIYGGYDIFKGEEVPAQRTALVNALGCLMAAHALFIAYQTVVPDRIVASVVGIPIAILYTTLPLMFLQGGLGNIGVWTELRTENVLVFLASFAPLAGQLSNLNSLDTLTAREYALQKILRASDPDKTVTVSHERIAVEIEKRNKKTSEISGTDAQDYSANFRLRDLIDSGMQGYLNPQSISNIKKSTLKTIVEDEDKKEIRIVNPEKPGNFLSKLNSSFSDIPKTLWIIIRYIPTCVFLVASALFFYLVFQAYTDPVCDTLAMFRTCAFKTYPLLKTPHCDCRMIEVTDADVCIPTTRLSVPEATNLSNEIMDGIIKSMKTTEHFWIASYNSFRADDTSLICPSKAAYTNLGKLNHLVSLQFDGGYRSTEAPDGIDQLTKLQIFRFTRSQLEEIPSSWVNLKELISVDLRYNRITLNGLSESTARQLVSLPHLELLATSYSPVCDDQIFIPSLLTENRNRFFCDSSSAIAETCVGGNPNEQSCIGACRPVFSILPLFDTNFDGLFTFAEFMTAAGLMGLTITPDQIQQTLMVCAPESLDRDGNMREYLSPRLMFVTGTQAASNCRDCPEAIPYYNAFDAYVANNP